MKKLYIALIIGILLIGIVTAGIILTKPKLSPDEIQKLKDCKFTSKYIVEKEWTNGDWNFVVIRFDNLRNVLIQFKTDKDKTFEQQLNENIEIKLKELGTCGKIEKDKHKIPKEPVDLEKE